MLADLGAYGNSFSALDCGFPYVNKVRRLTLANFMLSQ